MVRHNLIILEQEARRLRIWFHSRMNTENLLLIASRFCVWRCNWRQFSICRFYRELQRLTCFTWCKCFHFTKRFFHVSTSRLCQVGSTQKMKMQRNLMILLQLQFHRQYIQIFMKNCNRHWITIYAEMWCVCMKVNLDKFSTIFLFDSANCLHLGFQSSHGLPC